MSSKMDRQGSRTPADLERKYGFTKAFNEVTTIANDAKKATENLNSDEIFNRLTDGGQMQGIYKDGDKIYINASYIKTGELTADLIKAGVIRSIDGEGIVIDLDKGTATLTGSLKTERKTDEYGEITSAEISPDHVAVNAPSSWVEMFKNGFVLQNTDRRAYWNSDAVENGFVFAMNVDGSGDYFHVTVQPYSVVVEMSEGTIKGLIAPTNGDEAANKAYVDAQIAALKAELS